MEHAIRSRGSNQETISQTGVREAHQRKHHVNFVYCCSLLFDAISSITLKTLLLFTATYTILSFICVFVDCVGHIGPSKFPLLGKIRRFQKYKLEHNFVKTMSGSG